MLSLAKHTYIYYISTYKMIEEGYMSIVVKAGHRNMDVVYVYGWTIYFLIYVIQLIMSIQ